MAGPADTPSPLSKLRLFFLKRDVKHRLASNAQLRRVHAQCTALRPRRLASQPIETARFVVIDTETTGLQVYAGDEIVSIAMLEYKGFSATGREFVSLVNPCRVIPAANTAIHGVTDEDVADAPTIDTLMVDIIDFIADAIIVGHHINFDLRFLNKNLQRLASCKLRNPALDTMLMYLGHSGSMGNYSLEEVAKFCNVEVTGRHTAVGDAITTARIFNVLSQRLVKPHQPVALLMRQQQDNNGLQAPS